MNMKKDPPGGGGGARVADSGQPQCDDIGLIMPHPHRKNQETPESPSSCCMMPYPTPSLCVPVRQDVMLAARAAREVLPENLNLNP